MYHEEKIVRSLFNIEAPPPPQTLQKICNIPIKFVMPVMNNCDNFTSSLFSSKTPSTIYTGTKQHVYVLTFPVFHSIFPLVFEGALK